MIVLSFFLSFARAEVPSLQNYTELGVYESYYAGSQSHGPEKPPPDDGYDFKGARGGNALGKLGLLMMGAGTVTGVMTLGAEKESERRDNLLYATAGLWGGGIALLLIERAS